MSKHSDKKIMNSSRIPLLLLALFFWIPIVLKTALVLFGRWGFWELAGLALSTLVGMATRKTVEASVRQGMGVEGATHFFDLFALNTVVCILSLLWDWAWYLYLVLPGYLVYKLLGYLFSQVADPEPEPSPNPAD
jgi:hypothetical protein